jgi:hypothetical protein
MVTVLVLVLTVGVVVAVVVVVVVVVDVEVVVVVVVVLVVVSRSERVGGTTTLHDRDVVCVGVMVAGASPVDVDVNSTISQMNATTSSAAPTPAANRAAGLRYHGSWFGSSGGPDTADDASRARYGLSGNG